ncbi:hypothetical protein VX159_04705 [Dechloromonas sp. ZY10]|uniref:hypothetical protein n=1 Tax=Dechloromonas aquae TaxID=2664436 RepID=UPI003528E5A0
MHPSARLALWLLAVLAAQALHIPTLLVLGAGALLATAGALPLWLGYCRRARWLLLTLWLVLAWHAPGEAWFEQAWLPTREGVALASEQAIRLLTVLACLAWVYAAGGRAGMLAGLWGLLAPWQRQGGAGERLVVRLALVLEHAQQAHPPGVWKEWLAAGGNIPLAAPPVLRLEVPRWGWRDSGGLLLAALALGSLLIVDGML